nr:MAG TPA: hypothetical protein [Caudoviricetes sp.]
MKNLSLSSPNILYPANRLKMMIVISIIIVYLMVNLLRNVRPCNLCY